MGNQPGKWGDKLKMFLGKMMGSDTLLLGERSGFQMMCEVILWISNCMMIVLRRIAKIVLALLLTFVVYPLGLMVAGFVLLSWGTVQQAPDAQALSYLFDCFQWALLEVEHGIVRWVGGDFSAAAPIIPADLAVQQTAEILRMVYALLVASILACKLIGSWRNVRSIPVYVGATLKCGELAPQLAAARL